MTENTLDVRLLHAAKTLADWNTIATVPKLGEVCLEIQGNTPPLSYKIKVGDGASTYARLPYFGSVINTNGNASVVVVDTVADGGVTKKVLKFYKLTLTTSTVDGVTTITPAIGDLILTVQEGTGINFATNSTDTLVEVELEDVTADTAQTITDGGTFTVVTKDSNNKATKYTTFTLPSITNAITALDVADNTVITAEWDATNKQIKLYYIKETDGKIQKGSLAYTINATDIAPLQNITTTDTGTSGLEITTDRNVKDIHHKTVAQNIIDNSSTIEEKELNVVTNVEVDSYGHITGYTKDKSTNLVAADIKAPVRQSDNSMWNHRMTGGTINIGEDTAKISKLRGNTIVWNQLCSKTDLRDRIRSGVEITIANDGGILFNGTVSDSVMNADIVVGEKSFISGHRYFLTLSDSNINLYLYCNGYLGKGGIYQPTNGVTFQENIRLRAEIGAIFDNLKTYLTIIDLTKMFGTGNEPTTVEEFEAMFPNSYYPYNEGELISLNPTGVKSVGFNLWDEEWEVGGINAQTGLLESANEIRSKNLIPIISGQAYYMKFPGALIIWAYSADGTPIERLAYSTSEGIKNFGNVSYIKFCTYGGTYGTTYNHDICINLSDSSRNGTYEPYKESTLDLSWIKSIKDSNDNQLFPYGLLSAGSVHDEVGDNYAIKRIGSVDLGSLTYTQGSGTTDITIFEASFPTIKVSAECVSTKFTKTNSYITLRQTPDLMWPHDGQNIIVFSASEGQYTDTNAFKTAMQGVMLYYELATPVTVYFDKKPMTYPVDDLGTETLLPEGVDSTTGAPLSAPFNGTFEYKSNFKDTVLELIDKVNNNRNPVKGATNTNQTVGKLAIYDSIETVKASNYSPSNATIVENATDNDIILPSVETIINYVNTKLSSALNYKGTISRWSELPISGQNTGDMYIAATTFTEDGVTYQAGDFFIWNGTDWDIVTGTTSVTDNNPTLTLNGNTYQVGTVDGVALRVTTPNLAYSSPSSVGQSVEFIDSVSQVNGLIAATKKAIPTANTTINGTNYDILVPPSTSLWASIYAPTTAGTTGQILKSTSGTPVWANLDIRDLGLYSKNLEQVLNGQSITLGDIIRTSNENLNLPAFYAPLEAGTSYNLLMSNGSGAPSWTTFLSTDTGYLKKTSSGWSLDPYGGSAKESVMNDGSVIAASSSATAGLRKQTGTNTYEYQKISFGAITNDTATSNNAVTIILNGNFN